MQELAIDGKKLKALREERGWSQGQLEVRSHVSQVDISRYENGRRKNAQVATVAALAEALNVRVEDLLARNPRQLSRTPHDLLRELERTLPILVPEATQYAHAGEGSIGYLDAEPWAYYPRAEERRHDFVAIPVNGSCMEPRIRKGERVVVDKSASPRPGDIVVAIHKGEALVKELKREGDKLVLTAIGPEPPIDVNADTEILGVVRMVMHRP